MNKTYSTRSNAIRAANKATAETGDTYIIEAVRRLGEVVFRFHIQVKTPQEQALAKIKAASKTKFTCPDCGLNAWAKPDAVLGCWNCKTEMGDN